MTRKPTTRSPVLCPILSCVPLFTAYDDYPDTSSNKPRRRKEDLLVSVRTPPGPRASGAGGRARPRGRYAAEALPGDFCGAGEGSSHAEGRRREGSGWNVALVRTGPSPSLRIDFARERAPSGFFLRCAVGLIARSGEILHRWAPFRMTIPGLAKSRARAIVPGGRCRVCGFLAQSGALRAVAARPARGDYLPEAEAGVDAEQVIS
jgi:hypothetical protein